MIWRLLHWKKKKKVRLLKCVQTFFYLAKCMHSLFNLREVQMVRIGMLVSTLLFWPLEMQPDKENYLLKISV